MAEKNHRYNRVVLSGCGMLVLAAVFGIGLMLTLAFNQDRQAARYPGSLPVASHNNYSKLPYHYRWDNTYRTTDPFPRVYHWYSVGFNLGTEARANGGCILLEGTKRLLTAQRHTSVLLCDTPSQRMIFVSRSTSLR